MDPEEPKQKTTCHRVPVARRGTGEVLGQVGSSDVTFRFGKFIANPLDVIQQQKPQAREDEAQDNTQTDEQIDSDKPMSDGGDDIE